MPDLAPYLIRAYHQWMEDCGLTPHILVDCSKDVVVVPKNYIQHNRIVLNISQGATQDLLINNQTISFKARFDSQPYEISVPVSAALAIYAGENGEGMFFEQSAVESISKIESGPSLTLLD